MHSVYVRGSHGTLVVDRLSGMIVERERDGDGYDEIVRFDTVVFDRNADVDDFDILETGYWVRGGGYAEPLSWCQIWDHRSGPHPWIDWQPFRLLPCPTNI
jgi:hypothetical protein